MLISRNGLFVAFVVLVIATWLSSSNFMRWTNVWVVLEQSASVGIVSALAALLLMAGHVDLSVGSTQGLAAIVAGALFPRLGLWAPLVGLAAAMLVGLVNGYLSTYQRMSPIIVTLGTLTAVRGFCFVITGGLPTSGFGNTFDSLGQGTLGPGPGLLAPIGAVPVPVLMAAAVFIVSALFLYKSAWGRHTIAIGVKPAAAFAAGIDIRRLPFFLYILTATAAGFSGLIEMARLDSAPPTLGTGFELQVLTAILLGGVAFGGGRGSMFGVLIGVLFLSVLNNGLILNSVAPFWVQVASGVALVFAAALNVLTMRVASRRRHRGDRELAAPALSVGTPNG